MLASVSVAGLAWYLSRPRGIPVVAPPRIDRTTPAVPRRLPPPRPGYTDAAPRDDTFAAAFERGVAAYNADDVEAAADAFEEAVRLAPSDPEAHINLGLVYMRLQRPEDGLRELATGAELERARGRSGARSEPSPDADESDGTIDTHEGPGREGR